MGDDDDARHGAAMRFPPAPAPAPSDGEGSTWCKEEVEMMARAEEAWGAVSAAQGMGEAALGDDMGWVYPENGGQQGSGPVLRMLDDFVVVGHTGELMSLEALDLKGDEAEGCRLFGHVIQPVTSTQEEPPRLWERGELEKLHRSQRVNGIECKEICIDLTYGDESIWVIAASGVWYKLRGEQGPGSALRPSTLYREAFSELRLKYESCLHIARLLQDSKAKMSVQKLIKEAVALSNLGEWPVTMGFVLSRASFIMDQVREVHNFARDDANAGKAFCQELVKRRSTMVKALAKQEEQQQKKRARPKSLGAKTNGASKKSRNSSSRSLSMNGSDGTAPGFANNENEDDEGDFNASLGDDDEDEEEDEDDDEEDLDDGMTEGRAKKSRLQRGKGTPGKGKSRPPPTGTAGGQELRYLPVDDIELLRLLELIAQGQVKAPIVIRKLPVLDGFYNPLNPLPLPPKPAPVFVDTMKLMGMSHSTFGSLLGSCQAIDLLTSYLGLNTFGLEEFLQAVFYRPMPPAINGYYGSTAVQPKRLSFASPLYVEIMLQLLRFYFDQPENLSVRNAVLGDSSFETRDPAGKEAEMFAGAPSALNVLTWPFVLQRLIAHVEGVALPEELQTLETVPVTDDSNDKDTSGVVATKTEQMETTSQGMGAAPDLGVKSELKGGDVSQTQTILQTDSNNSPQGQHTVPHSLEKTEATPGIEGGAQEDSELPSVKSLLEAREVRRKTFPTTTEALMLLNCRTIVEELMQDPVAGPFTAKVDPEALGIPDYFDVIENPMDLGTIYDRLYSGFYCKELAQIQLEDLRALTTALTELSTAMCSKNWQPKEYLQAREVLDLARQQYLSIKAAIGGDHKVDVDAFSRAWHVLEWALNTRRSEYSEIVASRRRLEERGGDLVHQVRVLLNSGSHPTALDTTPLRELLSLQDCILLEPITFERLPIGINVGNLSSHTSICSQTVSKSGAVSEGLRYVTDAFHVVVTNLFRDQACFHRGLLETVQNGDLVVAVGPFLAAEMHHDQVADALQKCTFPITMYFARKSKVDLFLKTSFELEPPKNLAERSLGSRVIESHTAKHLTAQENSPDAVPGTASEKVASTKDEAGENDEDDEEEGEDGEISCGVRGGGLESFYSDVQVVFSNCIKFNPKRAQISIWATTLKENFEALYQKEIGDRLERLDATRLRRKLEQRQREESDYATLDEVLSALATFEVVDIPPPVRVFLVEWLVSEVMQTDHIRSLIETGTPSQALIERAKGRVRRSVPARMGYAFTPVGPQAPESDLSNPFLPTDVLTSPYVRLNTMGCDRAGNRYWYFDNDFLGRIFVEYYGELPESESPLPSFSWQAEHCLKTCRLFKQQLGDRSGVYWGIINTVPMLNQLVVSLNPMGKKELELLANLNFVYPRLVSRMVNAPGAANNGSVVSGAQYLANILQAKVDAGANAGTNPKSVERKLKRVATLGPPLPPTPPDVLARYTAPHLEYGTTKEPPAALPPAIQVFDNGIPTNAIVRAPYQVAAHLSKGPSRTANQVLLARTLLSMEEVIWASRPGCAFGEDWPWLMYRGPWRTSLEVELREWSMAPSLNPSRSSQTAWPSKDDGAVDSPELANIIQREVSGFSKALLHFESNCVSYLTKSKTKSNCATCVSMQWRTAREHWRIQVRRARTFAALGALCRRLMIEAIRWEDTDRSVNVLFTQHLGNSIVTDPSVVYPCPVWEKEGCENQEVSFGQLVSCTPAFENFGFVAAGAFLGIHLYCSTFGQGLYEAIGLHSAFKHASSLVSRVVLTTAAKASTEGALGLRVGQGGSGDRTIGRMSVTEKISLDGLGIVKQAVLQVMAGLGLRQKDVAEQLACSQSHLSLWLNGRGGVDKRKFEVRVVNWLRVKNMVHGWVKAEDLTGPNNNMPINIHAGVELPHHLPGRVGSNEAVIQTHWKQVVAALLPVIQAVVDPHGVHRDTTAPQAEEAATQEMKPTEFRGVLTLLPSEQSGGQAQVDSLALPKHPYSSMFKSSLQLRWEDTIPFRTSAGLPRVEGQVIDRERWLGMLSDVGRRRMENSGLDLLGCGHEVVYFPEGHAFANSHCELRMGTELLRGNRQGCPGPTVEHVLENRSPVPCQVRDVKFYSWSDPTGRTMSAPYAVVILVPETSRADAYYPMVELDPFRTGAKHTSAAAAAALANPRELELKHVLGQVMMHLMRMSRSSLCMYFVSPKIYKDLEQIVGPEERHLDLATIQERVQEGHYASAEDFLQDLALMAENARKLYTETHKYGASVAQAAHSIVMRAQLLIRHPETLCVLHELTNGGHSRVSASPPDSLRVIIRPHLEVGFPTWLVSKERIYPSLYPTSRSGSNVSWNLGMRVVCRGDTKKKGTVVGFRFPLRDMQLPWGAVVVRWANTSSSSPSSLAAPAGEVDLTLDMPLFACQQMNPWDIEPCA